jgi:hypothetical protein
MIAHTLSASQRLRSGPQSSRPDLSRPLVRPTLLPGLRRMWRGRHSLQLGVDPAHAVVLELPDARVAGLLDLLDGARSERAVLAAAVRQCRVSAADARQLLDALCAAGLVVGAHSLLPRNLPDPVRRRLAGEAATLALRGTEPPGTPAQILRRRSAARVVVAGHGQLAGPVGVALAQAGVGHVAPAAVPGREPADSELAAAIARAAPGTKTFPLRHREATFAIQVGAAGPAVLTATGYAQRRLAHLAVAVRDGTVAIGPLVPPGGSPCLNCIDLHRTDRDPQWPLLAAQLAVPGFEPCAATTALFAAGLAAAEVLAWLDGVGPAATLGASIEITAPGRQRRRSWSPHPGCHCVRRSRRSERARAQ